MSVDVTIDPDLTYLVLSLVEARDIRMGEASAELRAYCQEVVQRTLAHGLRGGDERRTAVRQLLRAGGYKPSGRNKPAQEYLLRTVTDEGRLPAIGNAVDLINAVSLDCGLPISLVAIERTGPRLSVRCGREGERYTFNRAGQDLDLAGLLCLCAGDLATSTPVGTPVKDSLTAKVVDQDRHVMACIYAPAAAVPPDELELWAERLQQGFRQWCGAGSSRSALVPGRH